MAKLQWEKVRSGRDLSPERGNVALHAYQTADKTGNPKPCRDCGETIVLCKFKGRWSPYNPGGARHRCGSRGPDRLQKRQIGRAYQ